MLAPSNLRAKFGVTVGGLGNYVSCRKSSRCNPNRLASPKSQDGLDMGDADYRKPLTPAQLIEQLERSNPTVIAQILSNDAQITLRDRLLLRAWLRPRYATEPLQ
jgi:hypothetical protein